MTINDPGTPHTTEVKRTYGAEPERTVVHTTEVRESSSAWWIGALVAIVAILAVVYLVTRGPAEDPNSVATALEQGRLQGALESTQSTLSSAQDQAARASQQAADATAAAASRAADEARAATQAASDAAARAAERTSTTIVVPPVSEPVG
jgi:hypothetical protein